MNNVVLIGRLTKDPQYYLIAKKLLNKESEIKIMLFMRNEESEGYEQISLKN